jgi:hypothetical protein
MNSNDIYMNAGSVPNVIDMTIEMPSRGTKEHYKLTEKQREIYEKLKDNSRASYVLSFIISFLGFVFSTICIILLLFEYTRKYAFYALCIILILWFSFVYYLDYKGTQNADNIDALLRPLKI